MVMNREDYNEGMSLRDYFAAKAMQGMLANSIDKQQGQQPWWNMSANTVAKEAYDQADAMLLQRSK